MNACSDLIAAQMPTPSSMMDVSISMSTKRRRLPNGSVSNVNI